MQRDISSSTLDSFFSSTSSPLQFPASPTPSGVVKQELSTDNDECSQRHADGGGRVTSSPVHARDRRSTPPTSSAGADAAQHQSTSSSKTSPVAAKAKSFTASKRIVCDHCRRRRIRCDGNIPCQQCIHATLACKRDHVPKKRGPKRGHGRVIDELRESDKQAPGSSLEGHTTDRDFANHGGGQAQPFYLGQPPYLTTSGLGLQDVDYYDGSLYFDSSAPTSGAPTGPSSPIADIASYFPLPTVPVPQISPPIPPPTIPHFQMPDAHSAPRQSSSEPTSPYTTNAFRPNSRDHSHLIPRCLELYYEHIYPIMPILYMPAIRLMISRPMNPPEKNLVFAMCAMTSFHMSGKSLASPNGPSWEMAGKFFLDECISVRHEYDFLEDVSLSAVISSFWLSTSFFEINQSRKSWYYLREALTLALDLGLDDDKTYQGLSTEEVLCRRRVFWILYVTERSFAILRNKPLTLRKTPSLPARGHPYEDRDIHAGFLKLVRSYIPLDESFVNAWNDGSDPQVSAATYSDLQRLLAQPLDFLLRPSRRRSSALSRRTLTGSLGSNSPDGSHAGPNEEPEPTDIQKADLLMTQQWLRLIVWQSSFRQGLLSTATADESMTFSYPLSIAKDTAAILQSLPSHAVEVHGMGIFEKIFEIGTWCVNVLNAYDSGPRSPSMPFGGAAEGGIAGMDYVGGGDMGVLVAGANRGGRWAPTVDPLEFFVKTLSASPNSRTMFAEKLLMLVEQSPGAMRASLSPAIPFKGAHSFSRTATATLPSAYAFDTLSGPGHLRGSVAGEEGGVMVVDENAMSGQQLLAELDDSNPFSTMPAEMMSHVGRMAVPEDIEMELSPTSYSFPTATTVMGHGAAQSSMASNHFAKDGAIGLLVGTIHNEADEELLYHGQLDNEYSFSRADPGTMSAGGGSAVGGLGLMNMDGSSAMAGGDNTRIMRNSSMEEEDEIRRRSQQQQDMQPPRSSTVDGMW